MTLSFQLYSARNYSGLPETLSLLAELGVAQVEGYGDLFDDPAATAAALEAAGLQMPSGHILLDALEAEFDTLVDAARTLGLNQLYAPYLDAKDRPSSAEGWAVFAHRLAKMGDRLAAKGLRFGWHNHDFEFQPTPDGAIPMQVILQQAPEIAWEADIAWIARGGADPFAWIAEHGARIEAAHVKDIAPEGEAVDEDGWADLGHGVMPWVELLPILRAAGCTLFVLEHDNPSDIPRYARRSVASYRAMT